MKTMKAVFDMVNLCDKVIDALGFETIEQYHLGFSKITHIRLLKRDTFEGAPLSPSHYGYLSFRLEVSDSFFEVATPSEIYEHLHSAIEPRIVWGAPEVLLKWLETQDYQNDLRDAHKPLFVLMIDLFKARLRLVIAQEGL